MGIASGLLLLAACSGVSSLGPGAGDAGSLIRCAEEGSTCVCDTRARMGAGGKYTDWIEVAVSVPCLRERFGGDPAPGVVKHCECNVPDGQQAPTAPPGRAPCLVGHVCPIEGAKTQYIIKRRGASGRGAGSVLPRATATVRAVGRLATTGEVFWPLAQPAGGGAKYEDVRYRAGEGGVVAGWAHGCAGMSVGEIRELLVPAEEGYGDLGMPEWGVPGGAALNFTVELVAVVQDAALGGW